MNIFFPQRSTIKSKLKQYFILSEKFKFNENKTKGKAQIKWMPPTISEVMALMIKARIVRYAITQEPL